MAGGLKAPIGEAIVMGIIDSKQLPLPKTKIPAYIGRFVLM
jgi:hypothetical protein